MIHPWPKVSLSLRLGNEEFRGIKNRCRDIGDLRVSEFIRAAMLQVLNTPELFHSSSMEVRLAEFHHRLDRLQTRLEEIARTARPVAVEIQ